MRAQDQRFFLLQEPLSANEVSSFLGRLVVSKVSPLEKYAPSFPSDDLLHRTNDIIPCILPKPEIVKSVDQTTTVARERSFSMKLSALLNIDLSRTEEESRGLQSELVKKYILPLPEDHFLQLMQNEGYAQDVIRLLQGTRSGRAYFVTGIITATESTWTVKTTVGRGKGFNTTVPVGEAVGIPDPGLLDVGFGLNGSTSNTRSYTKHVAEEQIIALAYSVVKLSSKLTWSPNLITQTPVIGRPKRAKGHHLSMGGGDEDEEEEFEWDSDDEEGAVIEARPKKTDNDDGLEITLRNGMQPLEHGEDITYLDII
ncbi:hypothetical protein NCS52_01325000 [Fusarium sp. LHS14.1]|nr:hypothetical protein NCS52_01325000 [Fusarium sp. LHS14.1]